MLQKIKNIFKKQDQTNIKPVEEQIKDAFESLCADTIAIKIGEDLIDFGTEIVNEISILREDLKNETGFILPPVRVVGNDKFKLQENQFIIEIRGKKVIENFVIPNLKTTKEEIYSTLKQTSYNHIDQIFTMEICEKYINFVQQNNSWLIWDISKQLNGYEIREILINILKNKKSIFDIVYIFEQIEKELLYDRYRLSWNLEQLAAKVCSTL